MNYFLSTKYKLGQVQIEDNILIDGGVCYKHWEGKNIKTIFEHYLKKCNKTQIKNKVFVPRLINLEELHDKPQMV